MLAHLLLALIAGIPSPLAPPATPAATVAPLDRDTHQDGFDIACTGIGADARQDPRWQSYGVRIEFSNARNEYLVGGVVTLRDAASRPLFTTRCEAPWLLLKLPPGRYTVEATIEGAGAPRSARIAPPATGQLRVVLQFAGP